MGRVSKSIDLPADNGGRRKCVLRPLSLVLNSQYPSPPLSAFIANTPYLLPADFNSAFHNLSQATTFFSIRPPRDTNGFNGPGEALSSLVYTLNPDNTWEVNWNRTHAVRTTAQSSPPPQFTTYVPADHRNPHQWTHNGDGYFRLTQPVQSPQLQPQTTLVSSGSVKGLDRSPHNKPPGSNIPSHSPRTSVDPLVAGLSDHCDTLGSDSTATTNTTKCGGRRPRDSISSDTSEKRNFKCEACGTLYSRKAELDRHQKTNKKHSGIGKFSCGCCGMWFMKDDTRLRHERRHAAGEESRSSSSSGSGKRKRKERDTDVDINDDEGEDGEIDLYLWYISCLHLLFFLIVSC
ncbi:hypothetical protein BDV93DRAFT_558109 [Ceratobasidium sp. AG-I]|nr:hypothetical protein BDV93DRAFT_558109 [Ceratobasidium sp. AG-I]